MGCFVVRIHITLVWENLQKVPKLLTYELNFDLFYSIFSDEDLAENENSQEKSDEEVEENNTFFISTQPSNEPEKVREASEEPSDSENEDKDQSNLLRGIDNKTVRK